MRLVFLVQALFLTSTPYFDASVFKPFPAVTSCDIDGKAVWLLPTLFDARSKSHGFLTSMGPAPIKKASQDELSSGHGENVWRRSLSMRLVFLVQSTSDDDINGAPLHMLENASRTFTVAMLDVTVRTAAGTNILREIPVLQDLPADMILGADFLLAEDVQITINRCHRDHRPSSIGAMEVPPTTLRVKPPHGPLTLDCVFSRYEAIFADTTADLPGQDLLYFFRVRANALFRPSSAHSTSARRCFTVALRE
ncbi:uncharacterized protein LOC142814474 isoform X2 [Rhipicephalus microplus]|uniref:uncharacterized protein LOC142814474 isoform X2 n=1 Tax=Rhipicephalus microplus TaxID=6941 RepID=UPI003F6BE2D8